MLPHRMRECETMLPGFRVSSQEKWATSVCHRASGQQGQNNIEPEASAVVMTLRGEEIWWLINARCDASVMSCLLPDACWHLSLSTWTFLLVG